MVADHCPASTKNLIHRILLHCGVVSHLANIKYAGGKQLEQPSLIAMPVASAARVIKNYRKLRRWGCSLSQELPRTGRPQCRRSVHCGSLILAAPFTSRGVGEIGWRSSSAHDEAYQPARNGHETGSIVLRHGLGIPARGRATLRLPWNLELGAPNRTVYTG